MIYINSRSYNLFDALTNFQLLMIDIIVYNSYKIT